MLLEMPKRDDFMFSCLFHPEVVGLNAIFFPSAKTALLTVSSQPKLHKKGTLKVLFAAAGK